MRTSGAGDELANPWRDVPEVAPFVLPGESLIDRFNGRVDDRYRIHLEVPPDNAEST
jgi:hypothetical protein